MKSNRRNRPAVWLAAAAAAAGVGIGAAGIASAATGSTGTTSTGNTSVVLPAAGNQQAPINGQQTPPPDPASLPNGPGETVLTGSEASSVEAAVKAAEPTATIIRLETDSGSHEYEAHVKLADGSVKTLYFTSTFAADGSDTGFGAGPNGGPHGGPIGGQPGQAPTQAPIQPAGTTTGN
jgi:hypothetical protein